MTSIGFGAISRLYDNETFDRQFLRDIHGSRDTLLIESPFIRLNRVFDLLLIFEKLQKRGVRIIINTRPPEEHDAEYESQAMKLRLQGVKSLAFCHECSTSLYSAQS